MTGAASASGQAWRYSLGFLPKVCRKLCEKYDIELKPQAADTSRIDMRVALSSTRAYCSRSSLRILHDGAADIALEQALELALRHAQVPGRRAAPASVLDPAFEQRHGGAHIRVDSSCLPPARGAAAISGGGAGGASPGWRSRRPAGRRCLLRHDVQHQVKPRGAARAGHDRLHRPNRAAPPHRGRG